MQTSAKPARRGARAVEVRSEHHGTDVLGVVLLAASVVMVISLAFGDAGMVGRALHSVFATMFGLCAWIVPFGLAGFGVGLLRGRRELEIGRMSWGAGLLFLAIVGGFARSRGGDFFDIDVAMSSGGYLGAAVGWLFSTLLGAAKWVGLGALGMVGLILSLDSPIRYWFRSLEGAKLRPAAREAAPRTKQAPLPKEAVVRLPQPTRKLEAEPELKTVREVPKTKTVPTIRDTQTPNLFNADQPVPKEGYNLPPLSLLREPVARPKRTVQEMQANIETLESTLEEFNIDANVVEVATGPTITRYEIQLGPGIKVSRITALADNIAMNLAASHVRVEAPIPGKSAIGVEVPNEKPYMVLLRDLCDTKEFVDHPSRLFVALGQDVSGTNRYADLTKMPHLLIGGATNSGKSIGLATIITSLLMRNTPKDCKLVMIDPKRVELSLFDGVPHLMCPVVKDVKEAPGVLRAVWREMDQRYDLLSEKGVRNIDGWNESASFADKLPYIVVIIDELADLMIQAQAEVETSIVRLAQLARAVGIHLVIATQRPSVDVITGTIKANIPSRLAFSVSSHIDSRTILDGAGAEKLLGRGDMLFLPIDASKPTRIQGCYVSEKEIEVVCKHWKAQEKPHYVLNPIQMAVADREAEMAEQESDPLWEEVVRFVVDRKQASTSMIQRKFSIGFQRASRLLDMMEERGIVGPRDGPRPREVLVNPLEVDSLFGSRPVGYAEPPIEIDPFDD